MNKTLAQFVSPFLTMEKYEFRPFSSVSNESRPKIFKKFTDNFDNHETECGSMEKPTYDDLFTKNLYYGVFYDENVLGYVNFIDEGDINNIRVVVLYNMCSFGKQSGIQNFSISVGQFMWQSILELYSGIRTIIIVSNVLEESVNFWNKIAKPFTIEDCKNRNKWIGRIIKKIEPDYRCDNNFHKVDNMYSDRFYYHINQIVPVKTINPLSYILGVF